MKQKDFLLFFILILCSSCHKTVNPEELDKLNGYWEIVSVKTPDGAEKEFAANTDVDYIEYKNGKGFRQKMTPQFDGTFKTNDLKEQITLKKDTDRSILHCKTEFAAWEEEIISLSEETFKMKNEQDIIYHYKRYAPINIQPEK